MARRRFFVESVRGGRAELTGDDARHLVRVLRAEPGQRFEISDNAGLYLAEISEVSGQRVVFQVMQSLEFAVPPLVITLLAALIKFDRFEWIVEKATELGVARIVPVDSARSEKGLAAGAEKRRERWLRVARESSQQARRVQIPDIAAPAPFARAIAEAAGHRFYLEEEPGAPGLLDALPPRAERHAGSTAALAIGPEGGWSEDERKSFASAGWTAVSAGFHIMRAETAAVAGLAVLANAWLPPIRIDE